MKYQITRLYVDLWLHKRLNHFHILKCAVLSTTAQPLEGERDARFRLDQCWLWSKEEEKGGTRLAPDGAGSRERSRLAQAAIESVAASQIDLCLRGTHWGFSESNLIEKAVTEWNRFIWMLKLLLGYIREIPGTWLPKKEACLAVCDWNKSCEYVDTIGDVQR